MSSNIISFIILSASFLGLAFLFYRKIPALVNLPQNNTENEGGLVLGAKKIAARIPGLKSFSFEIFLQKILSQIRVLSLKTDHKTCTWLQKLREKNQKSRLQDDNYWEQLKDSTNDLKK